MVYLSAWDINFRIEKYMTKTFAALQRNAPSITVIPVLLAATLLALTFIFPASASAAMLSQELDFGMTNSDVTSLQVYLASNSAFYPEGIVSGYFGNLTVAAVKRFQTANGLAAVGRVGPLTLALINAKMGGSVSAGGDVSAPIMMPEKVTLGSNTANFSWVTTESAQSRVMYGKTWPFLYSTAPSVSTVGFGATSNITIAGLQSPSTYYYVRESIDGSGNVMWTVGKPLAAN